VGDLSEEEAQEYTGQQLFGQEKKDYAPLR